MYTRLKGQGMIAEVLIFAMAIFMAFAIFIFLSSDDAEFEQDVEVEIESSMESISDRSVLTTMLNDNVWRADDVEEQYYNFTAIKLTSHYLSTDDDLDIHGEEYSREKVEEDLEAYYSYKMEQSFSQRPEQQDYYLNITNSDGSKFIEVSDNEGRDGSWNSISLPFQLSGGEVGEITMYFRGTGGVFDVE